MQFSKLPDPSLFEKKGLESEIPNSVIYESSELPYHYPNHPTPYLFLANFKNSGNYRVNNRPISANHHFYYFLNEGDGLEIDFRRNKGFETLIVLFNNQFIKEVFNYRGQNLDSLLANNDKSNLRDLQLPSIPFTYTKKVFECVEAIRKDAISGIGGSDNLFLELLDELLTSANDLSGGIEKINAKKKSTREELYRRVLIARMYMEDNLSSPLSIEHIAKEACLNKFHFLKSFKEMYGTTPYQHLTKLRMERSEILLKSGKFTVKEVCWMIGFESQGSFTNLFKRYYGRLPSQLSDSDNMRRMIFQS